MTPVQEVDIHTTRNVIYKAQVIHPYGGKSYYAEVDLHDAEFFRPFSSRVKFHQAFPTAQEAYEYMLSWVFTHAQVHAYPLQHIDNPCNCEFIDKTDQEAIVRRFSLTLPVLVNGV